MTLGILLLSVLLLIGCSSLLNTQKNYKQTYFLTKLNIDHSLNKWDNLITAASYRYDVDKKLIKSIIYVESSGNNYAKSHSNAIGLMQIKPSTAGAEIYRLNKKKGIPSINDLYNPEKNINIGTAYIKLLQKKYLFGIKNSDIMKYATVVSYVNGFDVLLKMFSKNKKQSISIINSMTVENFITYVKKNIRQSKLHAI